LEEGARDWDPRVGTQAEISQASSARTRGYVGVMLLTPREFVRFLDGRSGDVQTIAFVPGGFTARIGAVSCDLLIRRDYAHKLNRTHGLRYEHWGIMQIAINHGYAILERGDLVFVYLDDTVFNDMFVLAIKEAANGQELWVKSFHRCEPRKLNRLLKNGELLREHT